MPSVPPTFRSRADAQPYAPCSPRACHRSIRTPHAPPAPAPPRQHPRTSTPAPPHQHPAQLPQHHPAPHLTLPHPSRSSPLRIIPPPVPLQHSSHYTLCTDPQHMYVLQESWKIYLQRSLASSRARMDAVPPTRTRDGRHIPLYARTHRFRAHAGTQQTNSAVNYAHSVAQSLNSANTSEHTARSRTSPQVTIVYQQRA